MALSSAGVGSGLDVTSLVSQLMAVERQPLTALDKKEASYQAKLSAFGTLKSALSSLQTAAQALSTPAKVSPYKASVADSSILSATAGAGAAGGNYNIEVQNLAESHKLLSAGAANLTDPVGTVGKKITFEFGKHTAGPAFTANTARPAKTITIDATNNSLSGLRDAINAANMGVSASIINDGTSYRLALSSVDTGASNAMKITVDDASLDEFAYDPVGLKTNMTQTAEAKDAVIKVDTVTITKPSNTITDAIQGVTLNLTKETAAGVTTKLTLTRDTASVQSAIQAFVKAYNDANKAIVDATAYNSQTGKGAVLNGDSTARSIQTQLRSVFSTPVPGAPTGSSMLADIGISFQRDGTLGIDSAKLSAAMTSTSKDLVALFAGTGTSKGFAQQIDILVGRITSPVGTIADHTKSIDTSIKSLGKQRSALATRLDAIEKRYRAQFTALDKAVASMSKTSQFLTQQLANMPKAE